MASTIDIKRYPGNIINNTFVSTSHTRYSINPATSEALCEVPVASKDDLNKAVQHAREAFISWSQTSVEYRSKLLLAFADAIEHNRCALEKLLTTEQGKPITVSQLEVTMSIHWLRTFASMEIKEEVIEETNDKIVRLTYPPVGVCGAIIPWNWPVLLGLGKVGSALMTGNTVILKPSPFTPYCNLKLGELAMSIFPPGVFQTLSGDNNLGPWMTDHKDIDLISFTGSTQTGKLVAEGCAKTLKRCVLELGGNDVAIVCEDVDIDTIIPKLTMAAFFNSGEVCMCVKRIYIHENIYDKFRDAMVEFAKKNLKTGGGFEPNVMIGPVQNINQFNFLKGLYSDVENAGYKVALHGKVRTDTKGYFVEPAIVDNPPDNSRIAMEEPFGPIIPLQKFSTEEEAIRRANASRIHLGASVWSKDVKHAEGLARKLNTGIAWVNTHAEVSPLVPFGGNKDSGFGREWGIEGFKQYTNVRSLWVCKNTE